MSRLLPAVAYAAIPAVAVLAADLVLRGNDLVLSTGKHVGLYILSVVLTVVCWLAASCVIARLFAWRRVAGWAVVGVAGLVEGLLLVGSYRYYAQFSVLPNVYAFEFLYAEVEDAAALLASDIEAVVLLAWALVGLAVVAWLAWPHVSTRAPAKRLQRALRGRWTLAVAVGLLVVAAPILHNNVPKFPNAFLPEVHVAFSWSKATGLALGGHSTSIRLLGSGTRPTLETRAGELGFDVLFILTEGVRRSSLSIYGYERDTTPNIKRFVTQNAGRTVLFDRCYASSTRSLLAFPSFLTGAHPVQPGSVMHTQPLLFDYAKLFSNVDTFAIASQSYAWGNFADFVRTPHLDHLWYREVSGFEASHGTGIDDAHVPRHFAAHLAQIPAGQRVVGLLHFYGTHQGYDSRDQDKLWGTSKLARYDASIHYLDRNMQAVFEALEMSGRLDDTLIIFASDHGEAFGEHGYHGHLRTYFDEEARVPLWIYLPRVLVGETLEALRRNANEPVSNADLIPTFLALTGLDAYEEIRARTTRLLGSSLTSELPAERTLLMQNYNDAGSNAAFVGVGLLRGRYKYLLRIEGGRSWEELYDLGADPTESQDLWGTAPADLRESLRAELFVHRNSRVIASTYLPKE